MIVCLAEARQEGLNTSILHVRQEKMEGGTKNLLLDPQLDRQSVILLNPLPVPKAR